MTHCLLGRWAVAEDVVIDQIVSHQRAPALFGGVCYDLGKEVALLSVFTVDTQYQDPQSIQLSISTGDASLEHLELKRKPSNPRSIQWPSLARAIGRGSPGLVGPPRGRPRWILGPR